MAHVKQSRLTGPTLHCDAEAQPRSEWTGNPLAEILKVREANGGVCQSHDGHRDRSIVGRTAAVGCGHADGERRPLISRSMVGSAIINNARSRTPESRLSVVADHFCWSPTASSASHWRLALMSESTILDAPRHSLRMRTNHAPKYEPPPSREPHLNRFAAI